MAKNGKHKMPGGHMMSDKEMEKMMSDKKMDKKRKAMRKKAMKAAEHMMK